MLSEALKKQIQPLPKSALLIEEAEFWGRMIYPQLKELPKGAKVLEVGSGPCILLSHLTKEFPDLQIIGIEPVGAGFSTVQKYISEMEKLHTLHLLKTGYEDFDVFAEAAGYSNREFDLIFLINVFEHLPSWDDFLDFVDQHLAPNGKCVVFCPNYGFPYESHFGIPIIFNKSLTRRIFSSYIDRFEHERNAEGLWDSLNFVSWSQVKRRIRAKKLSVQFDGTISKRMIERLTEDAEYQKRQRRIARVAKFLLRMGGAAFLRTQLLWNFHPYMGLTLTRS